MKTEINKKTNKKPYTAPVLIPLGKLEAKDIPNVCNSRLKLKK